MADMFRTLGTWNWLIFGFILMALELLAPGVFLFWLGLAALLVGLLSFAISPVLADPAPDVRVFAAAAVPLWRRVARSATSRSTSNPFLNKRADALVGRVFTLEKPIIDGTGTVRIDDTIWRVAGPDAPAGSRVKVVQADGASLTVAAAVESSWRPRFCSSAPQIGAAAEQLSRSSLAQRREAIPVAAAAARPTRPRAVRSAAPAAPSARPRRRRCAARARSAAPRAAPRGSASSSAAPTGRAAP